MEFLLKKILTKMTANSRLLAIELNQHFATLIDSKINDKRFIISCESATNISSISSKVSFPKADVILSSIPLAILPIKIKIEIINEIKKSLVNNGCSFNTSTIKCKRDTSKKIQQR